MATEIERKFLVKNDSWREFAGKGQKIRQGYLAGGPPTTVRVRLSDSAAWLTIKGPVVGISRAEYEYPIPLEDAEEMLKLRRIHSIIEKVRYRIPHEGLIIEVDQFFGENIGLVIAEVELPSEQIIFSVPDWLGDEVTQDVRFHNSELARNPYSKWKS